MDQILFMYRDQTRRNLGRNFQRQVYPNPARATDKTLQSLSFHKFHCVEEILAVSAQVEDRGDIRMTQAGCCAGLAQEPQPC